MEGTTEDFLSKFYTLEGNLVGERKRNFSFLLQELSRSDSHLIDHFVTNIQPRNYLESLFRIDALIYFKRTPELLEVLKENNEVFISKIFKHQWFFENAFKNFEIEALVNDFIPHLAYTNRKKFLKRIFLILDQDQSDRLFSGIYIRYGLWLARKFLHFCSEEKIKGTLLNDTIRLETNQVKYLFDRNEDLFINYLDYYKNTFHDTYGDAKVLKHVGQKHLELLLMLINDEKVAQIKLGKRTTKTAYQIVKDDIPQNFDKYINELNNSVMFRRLGKDFKNMYQKRLPRNFSNLDICFEFQILRNVPRSIRWSIFSSCYVIMYPEHDIMELNFYDIKNNCPDKNLIKRKAEITYKETEDNRYLKYMDISKSISILKEKINVTSSADNRNNLVNLLIECCSESDNLDMLESVLKYICERHGNEGLGFHKFVFSAISEGFNLKQLNENHWNCINDQIKILKLRNEFHLWSCRKLLNHFLEFLFMNNKDFKYVLKGYLDDVLNSSFLNYTLNLKNPKIERQILIEMYKYSDTGYIMECQPSGNHNFSDIIRAIMQFNKDYPEFLINIEDFKSITQYIYSLFKKTSDFSSDDSFVINNIIIYKSKYPESFMNISDSDILNSFKNLSVENSSLDLYNSLKIYIMKKHRNDLENEVAIGYFKQLIESIPYNDIINWFLKNEPQTILPYFQNIVKATDNVPIDIKLCKLYSHFNFDQRLIEFFKLKLQNDKPENKDEYMKKNQILLPIDEFIKEIDQFLPEKEHLDLKDKNMMDIYKVQCNIAKILHHTVEPHKMLPIVMKFFVGDYLQSALPSLYSIFYRSPERLLQPYVDIISKRAVSAQKHAVFLTCDVFDQKSIFNILTTSRNSNVSSQKHLFSATLKYFYKNPCTSLLNLVIKNMSTIDKNDKECLENLIYYYDFIPEKYKVPYVENCWSFFETLEQREVKINMYLRKLLSVLVVNVYVLNNLSTSFINHILNKYLGSTTLNNTIDFAASLLIHRKNDQIENFENVFNKISTMNQKQLRQFFKEFIYRDLDIQFVNVLNKYWNEHFKKIDTFWEHIYLNLWILHLTNSSQDGFAQDIIIYFNKIVKQFGFYSLNICEEVFRHFLINQNEMYKYQLFEKILVLEKTSEFCILILKILIPIDTKSDCYPIFKNILNVIGNVQDPLVIVFYKKYLYDHGLE